MSSWTGFFISLEGPDGAGKSTHVAALAASLRKQGYDTRTVREPGETQLGEMVRGYVLQHHVAGSTDPWAEALLFVAARVQLLREIVIPELQRGVVVISDRYADSTFAYQGFGRGLPMEELRRLHRHACANIWPDLTVLLTIPREDALGRQRAQQLPLDRIEGAGNDFHEAVARGFTSLAESSAGRIVTVDASRSAVAVSRDVEAAVLSALRLRDDGAATPGRPSLRQST